MKVKVSYAHCSLFVQGLDMNCPLCGIMVRSGDNHTCQRAETPALQPKKPRKKAVTVLKGKGLNAR